MKWSKKWFLYFLILIITCSIFGLLFINDKNKNDIISNTLVSTVGYCVMYGFIAFGPRLQLRFIGKTNKRYLIYLKGLKYFSYLIIILLSIVILFASISILSSKEPFYLLFIGAPFGFILGGFSILNFSKKEFLNLEKSSL